ncbi:Hypothetical protein I596_3316 [Dokdonella koreensis DS-123]|uniref:Uncharacterized protein n=1 Tax=Dokdonella koreensis DS-123 TaxID=1300342 RepID=A0A160DX75_9GAMM|nr:Hypothetical protein I596_3316 [Dokdonella koreensis DS-123]
MNRHPDLGEGGIGGFTVAVRPPCCALPPGFLDDIGACTGGPPAP